MKSGQKITLAGMMVHQQRCGLAIVHPIDRDAQGDSDQSSESRRESAKPSPRFSLLKQACLFLFCLTTYFMNQGCTTSGYAARWGTGIGALTGAMLGHGLSGSPEGVVVGALSGAVAGNLIGQTEDAKVERDIAIQQAAAAQQQQLALQNYDLIRMTQTGINEEVIVNAIQTQGGNFQLKPEDIIMLKNNGVSDRVIIAAQNAPRPRVNNNTVIVANRQPDVVVVERSPGIFIGPPPPPGINFNFSSRHHHCR